MLARIRKIIAVKPYQVCCLWNTGEEKWIDFELFLRKQPRESSFALLLDPAVFCAVRCDGRTLYWENLVPYQDLDQETKPGILDICPDVLYEWDSKIDNLERVEV
jgi:Protein of unknown function (DUF2442)